MLVASGAGVEAAEPSGEPPITAPGLEGEYLRAAHARVHLRWAERFLARAQSMPPTSPVNDLSRRTVLALSVRWDGSIAHASVAVTSGAKEFDRAVLLALRDASPLPVPPVDLFSDDGFVHLRWTLARDGRLCGAVELRRIEDPIEETLPRLLRESRIKEALSRVARARKAGAAPDPLTLFARFYLARPLADPIADAQAAAALARAGESSQDKRLRAALGRKDTVVVAARALETSGADVCALVRDSLGGANPEARGLGLAALSAVASMEPPARTVALHLAACVAPLAGLLGDRVAPVDARLQALELLAAMIQRAGDSADEPTAAARAALAAALKEPEPEIRGAALLATARPNGGRPALYRLTPLLQDPAPAIRAGAAAALVRSVGDPALEFMGPVLKDRDHRAAIAAAAELGRSRSQASLAWLERLLKREPDLRAAAVRALLARTDPAARELLAPHLEAARRDPRAPAELRALAARPAPSEDPLTLLDEAKTAASRGHACRTLLDASRDEQVASWLLAHTDRLPVADAVQVLSAWLDRQPAPTSAAALAP